MYRNANVERMASSTSYGGIVADEEEGATPVVGGGGGAPPFLDAATEMAGLNDPVLANSTTLVRSSTVLGSR